MTRYSNTGATGLIYGNYGVGVYGSGDIPDLRLSHFEVLPTDQFGSCVDALGQPVFGRGTAFWGFRADIAPKVKVLRSTKGFATDHLDNFSTVVAATDYPINLAAATVDNFGWTVVACKEPHFLKTGDIATFSGVPVPTQTSTGSALTGWNGSRLVDGSWVVSLVLSPIAFAVRQNAKPLTPGTTAMVATPSPVGLTLPFTVPTSFTYTTSSGSIATPSLTRIANTQTWAPDQSVVPGVEYYYTLWVNDPTVPGLWALGGEATFLPPSDHASIQRLFSVLPPYLTNVNYGTAEHPLLDVLPDTDTLAPGLPTTAKFLAGLAWEWDSILTKVDKVQRLWDTSAMPGALLSSAVATFGLPDEATFGMRSRRALVENAQYLNSARGTDNGLTAFVEALVGLPANVWFGQNLLLGTETSSFAYATGTWAASTSATLALSSNTSYMLAVPASTHFVTDATGTPGGCLQITGTAPTITLAGGILNYRLTSVNGLVRVETVRTHGLEVGDRVKITGAATGFNVSGQVLAVASPTQYTLSANTLPSPSTLSAGRTVYDSSTSVNPFAVIQGIPVTAGLAYQLSLYAATASGTGTVSATRTYWDAQGHQIGAAVSGIASSALSVTLGQVVGTSLAAPTGAAFLTTDISFTGAANLFYLDAVMLTQGGNAAFEDARTVYIDMTASPNSVASDTTASLRTAIKSRLLDNLQNQLPVGTAFRLSINGASL